MLFIRRGVEAIRQFDACDLAEIIATEMPSSYEVGDVVVGIDSGGAFVVLARLEEHEGVRLWHLSESAMSAPPASNRPISIL